MIALPRSLSPRDTGTGNTLKIRFPCLDKLLQATGRLCG